jgi:predicted aspartyl protease
MGRTFVTCTITGPKAIKDYEFLVDTGASLMGLPMGEIEELGLAPLPNGRRRFVTATGAIELDTYTITGSVRSIGFSTMVIPAPIPLMGYEMLQSMRLRVNPVSETLEEVPDDEIHPPFLL